MLLRFIRWASYVVILGLASGCAQDAAQLLQSAKESEAKGDRVAAILNLKNALQQDPNDGAIRYMLGRLYNDTFNPVAAEKEFLKARKLGVVEEGRVEVALARALRAQGKFEELLEKVSVSPSFEVAAQASVLALRGRAQHALRLNAEAQTSFEEAAKTQAGNLDVALLEAQIVSGKGDFDRALTILDGIIAKSPDHYDGWSYKAEILRALGRNDEAVTAYEHLLQINPLSLPALLQHSALLIRKGDREAAWKDVAVLRRVYKDLPDGLVRQGMLQLVEGKSREALDSAQAALAKSPELASATLLAGLAQYALGSYEVAGAFLRRAVAANPSNQLARRALVRALLQNGEPARALEVVEPALRDGSADAQLMAIAASTYAANGDHAKAMKWFDKAAELNPDNSNLKVLRALARLDTGDLQTGIDELESAVESVQKASPADEVLVLSLFKRGETERAWTAVQALEKRSPDNPIANNLKGLVLVAKGERDNAAKAFEATLKLQPSFLPAAKNLAQLDIAAGNPALARQRYEGVIAADPTNADALLALALLDQRLGNFKQAITSLEQAVKSAPGSLVARERLVRAYVAAGETQKANDVAVEALTAAPDDTRLVLLAAQAMLANGSSNQANETISQLLRLNSGSVRAYTQVAQFQTAAKLWDEAEATLKKGLQKYPAFPEIQTALVSLLVNQQRVDDAMTIAKDIEKRQPKAPIGLLLQGEIHEAGEQYVQAVDAYKKALALQPAGQIAIKLFVARNRAGDGDAAFTNLKDWVAAHDTDVFAHAGLGDLMFATGEYKAAAGHYEKVLKGGTVPVDVLNKLAWAYHEVKNPRALEIAEAAYKAAPNSGMVVDTVGWVHLDMGDAKRGLELLRRAALLTPDEPEIGYHLAVALAKAGNAAEAKAELAKLLSSEKSFASKDKAEALLGTLD